MVLIRQNRGAKIILHAKLPTFRAAKLKGFTVIYKLRGKFAAEETWQRDNVVTYIMF